MRRSTRSNILAVSYSKGSIMRDTMLFTMDDQEQLFDVGGPQPKKKKVRGPSAQNKSQRAKSLLVDDALKEQVYLYWVSVMRQGKRAPAGLDENRKTRIGWAVHDFGVEDCFRAIDGCAASEWHMGRNKENARHDDLDLIFRDVERVERFIGLAPKDVGGVDW